MGAPLPQVAAGEQPTTATWLVAEFYLRTHNRREFGMPLTAKVANEAIDWWNGLTEVAKLEAVVKHGGDVL